MADKNLEYFPDRDASVPAQPVEADDQQQEPGLKKPEKSGERPASNVVDNLSGLIIGATLVQTPPLAATPVQNGYPGAPTNRIG